jgi:hypothetical protein
MYARNEVNEERYNVTINCIPGLKSEWAEGIVQRAPRSAWRRPNNKSTKDDWLSK